MEPKIHVVEFDPRLGEHHRRPRTRRRRPDLVCDWGSLAVSLGSAPELAVEPGRPTAVTIAPDRPLTLVMAVAHREPLIQVDPEAGWDLVAEDEARWQAWTAGIDEQLPFRDSVCAAC